MLSKKILKNKKPYMRCFLSAPLIALMAFNPSAFAQGTTTDLPPLSREQVEWIVREYLLNNPEVIEHSMAVLAERRAKDAEARAQRTVVEKSDALFNDDMDPLVGNPNGPVEMVHFFDYQCGYCKSMGPDLSRILTADGEVRAKFKEFPILGPASVIAARAAMAADKQDRYWDMHQALMGNRIRLTESRIFTIAQNLGLDVERLRHDMEDPAIDQQFAKNRQLASELGINGTPGFVIGEQIYPTSLQTNALRDAISKARSNRETSREENGLSPRG